MPQDIQVYLIFFQYFNLRLLVDLTHKVTTKIGPSKLNFILVTTLTFKISIEACNWHYLSPSSRIKFLYLTIFCTKICTSMSSKLLKYMQLTYLTAFNKLESTNLGLLRGLLFLDLGCLWFLRFPEKLIHINQS